MEAAALMIRTLPAALLLLPILAWTADVPVVAGPPDSQSPALSADEVEVQLTSGDVVRGALVERNAEQVVLKCTVTLKGSSMTSVRTFPAAQVSAVVTLADSYKQRAASTPATGPEQAALARWCLEHGLPAESRRHAEKALAIESVNADALALMHQLGLVRIDGAWTNIDDLLKAKSLVRYDGAVTDVATRDKLKLLMGKKTADSAALAEAKTRSENLSGLLATAKERVASAEKQAADSTTTAAEADAKQKAVDAAKAADTAAADRVKQTPSQVVTKHSDGTTSTTVNPDLANAESAKSRTAAALTASQRALGGTNAASAKARKVKLDQDVAKAREDIVRLTKDQPLAQQAIPAKQTAAEVSAKAYADARAAVVSPADLPPAVTAFLAAEKK